MPKAVAVISMDPILQSESEALQILKDQEKERMKFVEKQVEDLRRKSFDLKKPHWDKIEARLMELNLLPKDYSQEDDGLEISHDENMIVLYRKDEKNNFFATLLGALSPKKT